MATSQDVELDGSAEVATNGWLRISGALELLSGSQILLQSGAGLQAIGAASLFGEGAVRYLDATGKITAQLDAVLIERETSKCSWCCWRSSGRSRPRAIS